MNILIINGHKYYQYAQGRLNKTLFDQIVKTLSFSNELQTTIVEDGYVIDDEIEKFKWADLIIFQTPINWFSVPWLLKKYIDEVYSYGIFFGQSEEYGRGGLFKNKYYMYSLTWNTPCSAFNDSYGFFDGRDVDDVILAMHKLQEYCGLKRIKTFSVNDVVHHPNISEYLDKLKLHLEKYILNVSFI